MFVNTLKTNLTINAYSTVTASDQFMRRFSRKCVQIQAIQGILAEETSQPKPHSQPEASS